MASSNVKVGILENTRIIELASHPALRVISGSKIIDISGKPVVFRSPGEKQLFPLYRVFIEDVLRLEDAIDAALKADDYPIRGAVGVGKDIEPYASAGFTNKGFWAFAGEFRAEEEANDFANTLKKKGYRPWIAREVRGETSETVFLNVGGDEIELHLPLRIEARNNDPLEVLNVPVGKGFHWEHKENLKYRGYFEVHGVPGGTLTLVNVLPLEDYLKSVVGSEMGEAPLEALKAQAIAARNTLLSTIKRHHYGDPFDICATDHCQVYLGIKAETPKTIKAVEETSGEILVYNGRICDTRFAKVCGGITESFENVWGGIPVDYLVSKRDYKGEPLTIDEESIRSYIDNPPDSFCSSHELFRWKVVYTREELEEIIERKLGRKVKLLDLVPLKRGRSGRIRELKIVTENGDIVIEGELKIRWALSSSHLYSSLFYPVIDRDSSGKPVKVTLKGGGFGHGVGMCQIGAIGMAMQGFSYRDILLHYYTGVEIKKVS